MRCTYIWLRESILYLPLFLVNSKSIPYFDFNLLPINLVHTTLISQIINYSINERNQIKNKIFRSNSYVIINSNSTLYNQIALNRIKHRFLRVIRDFGDKVPSKKKSNQTNWQRIKENKMKKNVMGIINIQLYKKKKNKKQKTLIYTITISSSICIGIALQSQSQFYIIIIHSNSKFKFFQIHFK